MRCFKKEFCPACGAEQTGEMTRRTFYICGSSDYNSAKMTFEQSATCKDNFYRKGLTWICENYVLEQDLIATIELLKKGLKIWL